ncbi:MAG: hypothetical protein MJB14_07645 [Spirochaetes bacterium]|nr:hypothetical protein [Spirochaetota bacterium]
MTAATFESSIFNVQYLLPLVYDKTLPNEIKNYLNDHSVIIMKEKIYTICEKSRSISEDN